MRPHGKYLKGCLDIGKMYDKIVKIDWFPQDVYERSDRIKYFAFTPDLLLGIDEDKCIPEKLYCRFLLCHLFIIHEREYYDIVLRDSASMKLVADYIMEGMSDWDAVNLVML